MNFFTKIRELLRQKEQIVKKPNKHDANLQKNSTLYFQVGLIICLLTTNALFEMYFETKVPEVITRVVEPDQESYMSEVIIEKKVIAMVKPKPRLPKVPSFRDPVVRENDVVLKAKDPVIETPEAPDTPPIATPPPVVKPKGPMGILGVEEVPIFPGCEELDGNKERIKCMSGKLAKLVQRKFDGDIAVEKGLEGMQRISVQFTINKLGDITDIRARAPHPDLEKEAKRVMAKVPKMQPGKQSDIPVDVVYSLPIMFKVQN